MGRKENTTAPTVSEKEVAAELAEGRKSTAEAEYVALCDDKKKVELSLETIREEIRVDKETLEKGKEEIFNTNQAIIEVKNKLRTENKAFEEATEKNKESLSTEQEALWRIEREKTELKNHITAMSDKFADEKASALKEKKDLDSDKQEIIEETKRLTTAKEDVAQVYKEKKEQLETLTATFAAKTEEKKSLENITSILSGEIEDQKATIANNKTMIDNQISKLRDQNSDIDILDKKIETKTIELKDLEKKAFTLLAKEDALVSREAFLRSQYERAGINWE